MPLLRGWIRSGGINTRMDTKEHLEKIRARCVELLATAEKRTPEKWYAKYDKESACWFVQSRGVRHCNADGHSLYDVAQAILQQQEIDEEANAVFIASCAGAAEAGWRSTIAAIDGLRLIAEHGQDPERFAVRVDLQKIIAAWPEELLT